jgi:hypothetical protein
MKKSHYLPSKTENIRSFSNLDYLSDDVSLLNQFEPVLTACNMSDSPQCRPFPDQWCVCTQDLLFEEFNILTLLQVKCALFGLDQLSIEVNWGLYDLILLREYLNFVRHLIQEYLIHRRLL